MQYIANGKTERDNIITIDLKTILLLELSKVC